MTHSFPGCALLSYVEGRGRRGLWATRILHKRTSLPLRSPSSTSLCLDTHDSSAMGHGQPSLPNPPAMGNRRVTEGGALITGHAGYPSPGIAGGSGPQQRAPHRPATSSTPGPSSWRYDNTSIYSPRTEDGEMAHYSVSHSTPRSPTIADPSCPRDPRRFIPLHRRLLDTSTVPQSRFVARVVGQTASENSVTAPPKYLAA